MIKDHELLKKTELLFTKKLIIWGAGVKGKELAEKIRSMISAPIELVDSDKKKTGFYAGVQINLPERIMQYSQEEIAIILSPDNIAIQKNILEQIELMGCQNIDIYTKFAVEAALCFEKKRKTEYMNKSDLELTLLRKVDAQANMIISMNEQIMILERMFLAEMARKAVYIYQCKKVGSVTLVNSTRNFGIYGIQIHNFSEHYLGRGGEKFIRDIIRKSSGKVISIVREPVARQVSLLWQYWGEHGDSFLNNYCSLEELENSFYSIPNREDEFEWYNNELQRVLNINIYDYPFDKKLGYTIIEKDGISLLLLTLEKMNGLEKVIGDFLGIDGFRLMDGNVAQRKNYYYAYRNYLENVKIPLEFWNHYYNGNDYMDYFYSIDEKGHFYEKWEKHINDK